MEDSVDSGECSYKNHSLDSTINNTNSAQDTEKNSPNAFLNAVDPIKFNYKSDSSHNASTQNENNNNSCGESNNLQEIRWSTNTTVLLIRLVEKNYDKFNTELKKYVWNRIASELSNMCSTFKVTGTQCDSKWKFLKQTYKKVLEYNRDRTGSEKKDWQHFEAMHAIVCKRPEIVSLVPFSCNEGVVCDAENPFESDFSRKRRRILHSTKLSSSTTNINGTSAMLGQSSESSFSRKTSTLNSAAQKRHKEKMQRQDRFLALYEKLVNFITKTNNNEPGLSTTDAKE